MKRGETELTLRPRRCYVIRRNFEQEEARPDFFGLRDRIWPKLPPPQPDRRSYVPPREYDEEDAWKPEEDYLEPVVKGEDVAAERIFPVITPKPVRVRIDPRTGGYLGVGKRKTAFAQIALLPGGTGRVTINGRSFMDYFPHLLERSLALLPFAVIERPAVFDVNVNVRGGGIKGQAEAIKLAISRALQSYNIAFRPALKKAGCLSRDMRIVEAKKAGRLKARKRPQWSKR